jgi:SAM-dependent methyltransferase
MATGTPKQAKLDRIAPLLKPGYESRRTERHYDCLDEETRQRFHIVETPNVSENPYHVPALQLIEKHRHGLVLDFGAGKRDTYFANVVNLEIVPYDSTDVISVGEVLPFRDGVFDAVHCNAVLEHVKDPFACAREIMRVLKPGGDLMCCVPFLQYYHGYPHHYFNMTHQGLAELFSGIDVLGVEVYEELRPFTALQEFVGAWAMALPEPTRRQFLGLRLEDLLRTSYQQARFQPYVVHLPPERNRQLATCNTLFGTKPAAGATPDLVCTAARYGAEGAWVDVTATLRKLVKDNHLFISCDANLQALLGDPAPGRAKQLRVSWKNAAHAGEVVVDEYYGRLTTPLWL